MAPHNTEKRSFGPAIGAAIWYILSRRVYIYSKDRQGRYPLDWRKGLRDPIERYAMFEREMSEARRLLEGRRFDLAREVVLGILYEEPDHLEALCLLSICMTESSDNHAALRTLEYYFKQGGDDAEAYEAMGCALLRTKEFGPAEDSFRRSLDRRPGQGSVYRNLGILYSQTGRPRECYNALQQAQHFNPGDILTLYALSSVQLYFGNYDEAKDTLGQLLGEHVPEEIREFARRSLADLESKIQPPSR